IPLRQRGHKLAVGRNGQAKQIRSAEAHVAIGVSAHSVVTLQTTLIDHHQVGRWKTGKGGSIGGRLKVYGLAGICSERAVIPGKGPSRGSDLDALRAKIRRKFQ